MVMAPAPHAGGGAGWVLARPLRQPRRGQTRLSRPARTRSSPLPMIRRRSPASSSFVRAAARLKAAKLRIGRVCRGGIGGRRVEAVGAEAGAGEEPQPCPLAELGEHVPRF